MTSPVTPSYPEFKRLARSHNVIPVFREIVVDQITPVSVYDRLHKKEPYSFLLESVEGGDRLGRYSFVGQRPEATFVCKNRQAVYRQGGRERSWPVTNPLQDLKVIFDGFKPASSPHLPRFWGGAVGHWSYDTVRFFERLPSGKPDPLGFPQGAFQFSGELVIFDRFKQNAKVIANLFIPEGKPSAKTLQRLYQNAQASIGRQITQIHTRVSVRCPTRPRFPIAVPEPVSLTKRGLFESRSRRLKSTSARAISFRSYFRSDGCCSRARRPCRFTVRCGW